MNEEKSFVVCEDILVPGPVLRLEHGNRYGSVAGLDDDELANPDELLQQIILDEWGPILDLPAPQPRNPIRPTVDQSGNLDWGAFGTIDFHRLYKFDKSRQKADELQEELRNSLIMFDMVKERVPVEARGKVIEYAQSGRDIDDLDDLNMWSMARWCLRARRIREEIRQLRSQRRS